MRRIIKIGTYVLIFLLPWQTRWIISVGQINGGENEFLTYSLYGFDILLIAVLLSALFSARKSILESIYPFMDSIKKGKFFQKENVGVKILCLFVLLSLVSIFVAENKMLAIYFELKLLAAMGFFWLLTKLKDKVQLATVFVVSLILPATLAVWQFVAQQTFASKWLGLSEHVPSAGGSSVVEIYAASGALFQRWLRAYGSFDHPNILGGVLVVGLLLSLWLLIEKWQHKILISGVLVLFSAAVFASLSRSAWLALAVGIISGSIFLFIQKHDVDLKLWLSGSLIVLGVFAVMFFNYKSLVDVRTQGGTRLENLSTDQRALFLKQSETIIKANLFFGVGAGNYIPTVFKENQKDFAWLYQPVHNVFLLVWSELGIFAVATFTFLGGFLFWKYGRKTYLSAAIFLALIPMMIFDHWLWSLHFGILFFALAASLIVGFSEKEKV